MKKKIQTYESTTPSFQQDPDLPPEVQAAIAAEAYQARTSTVQDDAKALPIPVFQGADDYSMRNRVNSSPVSATASLARCSRGGEISGDPKSVTTKK